MAQQIVHDPVCHMDIPLESAAGKSDYDGKTYYFCAIGCKRDFDADPEGVLKAEAEYDHSQPVDHGLAASTPVSAPAPVQEPKQPWWRFWG